MKWFGLLTYENILLTTLVKSNVARNGLIIAVMYLVTSIIRFHLSIFLSVIFSRGNFLDLITPIIISVFLSLYSENIYTYVATHREWYGEIVDHFMANYTLQRFMLWKRILMMIICGYVLLILTLIQIDNYFIFMSTVQTAISFIICDCLQQDLPRQWWRRLVNWFTKPKVIHQTSEYIVYDNYVPADNFEMSEISSSKQISVKSSTDENLQPKTKTHIRRNSVDSALSSAKDELLTPLFTEELDPDQQVPAPPLPDDYLIGKNELPTLPPKPPTPPLVKVSTPPMLRRR